AARRGAILSLTASLELVEVDAAVLDRASQPMPTELGTLDAIHLATVLLWKEMTGAAITITMATYDEALGVGTRAHGLPVIGLSSECRGRESNPHAPCGTQDFKSCASASSATPACALR